MSLPRMERTNTEQVRLKRALLLVGLYVIVLGVPALVWLATIRWVSPELIFLGWIVSASLFAVLAAIAPVIYLRAVRQLDEHLLHQQRRYHRTLIAASSGMTRIKDLKKLCRLIVHVVTRTVRLTHSGLFLYEPKEQRYVLYAVRHIAMMPSEMSVAQQDPLIELLQEKQDLIVLKELNTEAAADRSEAEVKRLTTASTWMQQLQARLIVPSFSNGRMLAFLVLGGKRSEEGYTTDDIAMFSGLASQAALAIENALFFEQLRANEAYMIQSEKLASLGQLASGMAHEIHNPLTIISGESQLYLERHRGKDDGVDALLNSIIEECRRAADITRRILRFAKPAPPDVTAIDVKGLVDESLMLAGYQVRLERIERMVSVQEPLPKVRGNQNQLQEVILNLILNACQAMGEKGGRLVLSAGCLDGAAQVELRVADTGPGIPPNKLTKIFDPFFTTKQTGTGLGLFVSQRIVQSHGGTIEVASTVGKGTCFTLHLPVWKEGPVALVSRPVAA